VVSRIGALLGIRHRMALRCDGESLSIRDQTMTDLQKKLREAVAFGREKHTLKHPCAQTCSGYRQGSNEGVADLHARLAPILTALEGCVGALEMTQKATVMSGTERWDAKRAAYSALETLRKALEGK